MDFFEVIQSRYSVRSYKPDPVEPEKLQQILTAAQNAPTACNFQAFKIVVIKTAGHDTELKRIYPRDFFTSVPYVLCVCSVLDKCWTRKDGKSYADVDAAIVMEHIVLAATDLGLGTCWIGAFDPNAARDILNLDSNLEPVAFTPLGYPAGSGQKRAKKPLEDLVIRWG